MPYEISLREDTWTFLCAAKDRWKAIIGGSFVFLLIGVAASMGLNVPPLICGIAAFCLAVALACFLCWREEHDKVKEVRNCHIEALATEATKTADVQKELAEYKEQEVFAFDFERTGVKCDGVGKEGGGKATFRFAIRNYGIAVARNVSLRGSFCYLPDCFPAKVFPNIDMAGEPVLPNRHLIVPFAITVLSGNCPGVVFRFTLTYQLGLARPISKKQHIWVRCNFDILFASPDQGTVALYTVANDLMRQASVVLDGLEQAPSIVSIKPLPSDGNARK